MDITVANAASKERICHLNAKTKKEAIHELVELIKKSKKAIDFDRLEANIFYREKLMSTGMGLGIGVPHVRVEDVKEPFITIGISREGISDYESMDGQDVKLIILIVAGPKQHREYLKLLAEIVRKIKNKDLREKIFNTQTTEEIYSIFTNDFQLRERAL